jgi:hypothetical protein
MNWIESHEAWFGWLVAASLVMLVVSPLLVGWLVVRLPADYFSAPRRHSAALWARHRLLRPVILVAKNLTGIVLVAAGTVMLIAPGQGLLTIITGILLVDFPGKYRVERWLVRRPAVWRSFNWLRERAGREPFESP